MTASNTTSPGTGGSMGAGGSSAVGPGTGGSGTGGTTTVSGGTKATGGMTSTGGATSKGGATSTGGSTSKGGATSAGGSTSKGGATSAGGSTSKGGATSAGGSTSKGGATSAGGTTAKGGTTSAGGTTAATIPNTCAEANKTLTANATGTHCGYTYEYWKDSGTGSLILQPDGYSVSWSGINNLLGRKGLRPGAKSNVVTYSADYQPNGNSYLCVYGWTTSPLIEYYIVDSWGTWKPPGGTSVGTVSCDSGTYDIYQTQRVQQPSIQGTQTFYQFWSVRNAKRTSGTITVGCHFDAWAAKGMSLGALYEVSMTVEGYQSSGTANVKMSIK